MLKFTDSTKTAAVFGGMFLSLAGPELWDSIGDAPTREAVLAWLAEGNVPAPADPPVQPTFAVLKAAEMAGWKALREPYFGRLASIASRLRSAGDSAGADSCNAVADSLLGLFTDPTVAAATDIAAYKSALKVRYAAAVNLATASAKAEFGKYDQ